ncbi:fatty acid desaturase family protein [Chondromyces crocatus]|uniref:Omega-3 fatty acid desaturase n=1 Tax=Chondromyces crocatus TaxID=52 RepID=A0A0K1E853_CHOCO|nr:fatty acid desaturase [Chondromyces crocatus]AKT37039.1 omega-3 fatty acid desaturase [Chondromyces crocatus]
MAGMEAVPQELLRRAYERKPLHLLKIPLHFALWGAATWVLYATRDHAFAIPIGLLIGFFIANLIRGLGAIAHDAVHGNCARSKRLSYLIALVCWAPSGMSVTLYRNYHLHHHRITNSYPDVDNFVVTDYTRNPLLAKILLLVVYSFAYPIYFATQMSRYVKRLSAWQRVQMVLELVGWWAIIATAFYLLPLQVFVFFYGVPFLFGAALASLTSMIEHYEMLPHDDDAYSSRTYGTSAHFFNFLWNNVSYHNEHHKYPGIPFYNLRSFHEAAYPYYEERVKAECYPGVLAIAFHLYGRILKLDVTKLDARYQGLNKDAERSRLMALNGIQPGVTA